MTRSTQLLLALIAVTAGAASSSAQETVAQPTSTRSIDNPDIRTAVTAVAIRYGKLAMTSAAHPAPAYLPTAVFKNPNGVSIIVQDGLITKLTLTGGHVFAVTSTRLTPEGSIRLIGVQTGLSAAPEQALSLADGTYTSIDGKNSLTIVSGRPSRFVLPGSTQGLHEVNDQPVPVVAPIRR
jgi:hypothetical protein